VIGSTSFRCFPFIYIAVEVVTNPIVGGHGLCKQSA